MNFGFAIDNRTCIGCHACSTACKAENEVPLGVNRTWVKYVEKGVYPSVRRTFQVTRCNHCANPPCVRICPVEAMFQRSDGIVDFDPEICIGCKACLQACPYDAIYIDPDSGTAAKCHFCAHRVEVGLEPACVVVCPEQAIVAGDLDDPESRISQLVSREHVTVRKPEQGTAPKLFYIHGDEVALSPTAAPRMGSYAFAEAVTDQARAMAESTRVGDGARLRNGGPLGNDAPRGGGGPTGEGPMYIGEGRVAGQMVQTAYNAQHKIPWHWQVPAYLVTKAVGAGALMIAALLAGIGVLTSALSVVLGLQALVFTGLTTLLLVGDLEKPRRFLLILTRPQWKSWLTRGAWILIGYTIVVGLWFLLEAAALVALRLGAADSWAAGLVSAAEVARPWLIGLGALLGLAAASYTAFLFGQAEGRDLWQSPLLATHLAVQALLAASAALLLVFPVWPGDLSRFETLSPYPVVFLAVAAVFTLTLLVDWAMGAFGELGTRHASETAARAAHAIRFGRYRRFHLVALGLGHLLPLALVAAVVAGAPGAQWLLALAGAAALIGLYAYEHAFVMAPQEIPNS